MYLQWTATREAAVRVYRQAEAQAYADLIDETGTGVADLDAAYWAAEVTSYATALSSLAAGYEVKNPWAELEADKAAAWLNAVADDPSDPDDPSLAAAEATQRKAVAEADRFDESQRALADELSANLFAGARATYELAMAAAKKAAAELGSSVINALAGYGLYTPDLPGMASLPEELPAEISGIREGDYTLSAWNTPTDGILSVFAAHDDELSSRYESLPVGTGQLRDPADIGTLTYVAADPYHFLSAIGTALGNAAWDTFFNYSGMGWWISTAGNAVDATARVLATYPTPAGAAASDDLPSATPATGVHSKKMTEVETDFQHFPVSRMEEMLNDPEHLATRSTTDPDIVTVTDVVGTNVLPFVFKYESEQPTPYGFGNWHYPSELNPSLPESWYRLVAIHTNADTTDPTNRPVAEIIAEFRKVEWANRYADLFASDRAAALWENVTAVIIFGYTMLPFGGPHCTSATASTARRRSRSSAT